MSFVTPPANPARRRFIRSVGLTAAGIGLSPRLTFGAEPASSARPNVLFILADQWRFSAFSHETDPLVQTPNFDRFAASGARFTRMHATNPVCTPNRSCILTSRFPHQHGMTRNNITLPPEEKCLAEPFAAAGYATHYIGKWHMDGPASPGFVPPGWRRRGFGTFEGFNRGHYYPQGAKYFTNEGKFVEPIEFESAYQTNLALDFMKRHRDGPFFCYLSWGPPHTPYRPRPEFDRFSKLAQLAYRPNVPTALRDAAPLQRELAGYYGLCETLDVEMGRVLRGLDELGLADNTLVVFSADHGDMQGSHGLYRKGKPQEESLHIPLFLRLPGRIRPGQKIPTLASSIDLMPTMTALCGLKSPSSCLGRDLSGAATGGSGPQVDSVYAMGAMRAEREMPAAPANPKRKAKKQAADAEAAEDESPGGEWRAVVTPTHKLVTNMSGKLQLWDLEKDPYELKNLAEERSATALKNDLLAKMKRWASDTGDPYPRVARMAADKYTDEQAAKARG
jgi:arylsulfatase A-like enzyme